jgi:quercetin 2,3-dioxygenase
MQGRVDRVVRFDVDEQRPRLEEIQAMVNVSGNEGEAQQPLRGVTRLQREGLLEPQEHRDGRAAMLFQRSELAVEDQSLLIEGQSWHEDAAGQSSSRRGQRAWAVWRAPSWRLRVCSQVGANFDLPLGLFALSNDVLTIDHSVRPSERAHPGGRKKGIEAMQLLRRAEERGQANHGWLKSQHTFSFADYYDPNFMGFGSLRVINDDRVAPGRGFGTHPHRDMEIISYVVDGSLEHKDSMGNGSIIRPGDVQRMTAGTGVTHSEFNPSKSEGVRFLQIWVIPDKPGLTPGYEQKFFGEERRNTLRLVASQDGREGSVLVHQDVNLYATLLDEGKAVSYDISADRIAWLQVVSGSVSVGEHQLKEGDALALAQEKNITLSASSEANFLLFDLKDMSS